jgi:hypothetical protein
VRVKTKKLNQENERETSLKTPIIKERHFTNT